jgi:hypothetical protein
MTSLLYTFPTGYSRRVYHSLCELSPVDYQNRFISKNGEKIKNPHISHPSSFTPFRQNAFAIAKELVTLKEIGEFEDFTLQIRIETYSEKWVVIGEQTFIGEVKVDEDGSRSMNHRSLTELGKVQFEDEEALMIHIMMNPDFNKWYKDGSINI